MSDLTNKKSRLKDLDLENIFSRELLSFFNEKCNKYNLDEEELKLLGLISYYEKLPYEYVSEVGVFKAQHLKEKLDSKISPVLRLKITDYMIKYPDKKVFEVEKMYVQDFVKMFGIFNLTLREDEHMDLKEYLENVFRVIMFVKDAEDNLLIGSKTIDGYTSEVRWNILPEYQDLFRDIVDYYNEFVSLDFEECTDEDYQKLWKQFRDDLDYKAKTGKFRDNIPVEPKKKGFVVARLTSKGQNFLNWYSTYIFPNKD
jgi:hypothetical protein